MKRLFIVVLLSLGYLFLNAMKSFSSLSSFQVDFGTTPSGVCPLDRGIRHRIKVRNTVSDTLFIGYTIEKIPIWTGWGVWPSEWGLVIYPGEERWLVIHFLRDSRWEELIDSFGVGEHTFELDFKFWNSNDLIDSVVSTQVYQFTILSPDSIAGSFTVHGKVVHQDSLPIPDAEVVLNVAMYNTRVFTTFDGNFSFSVPPSANWWLRVHKNGFNEAYAFNLADTFYTFNLAPFVKDTFLYERVKQVPTDIGFWRYDVSGDEQYILLTQGMENWADTTTDAPAQSKLMLYTMDGDPVWEYPMGWQAWASDLSQDGNYAVYSTLEVFGDTVPTELGLINAQTGGLIWKKEMTTDNFPIPGDTTYRLLYSQHITLSHNNAYIGLGAGGCGFYLLDRETGEVLWHFGTEGNARTMLFSDNDAYVYVGSYSGRLYKLATSDGTLQWHALVGSWPFHNALTFSPDRSLIATGVKSGEVSVIQTADGNRVWYHDLGGCVSWARFSPDGTKLAAGGTVFTTTDGTMLWRSINAGGAGEWSGDGKYVLVGEIVSRLYTSDGALVQELDGGFTTSSASIQVAYITSDASKIVLAARDMGPGGMGIAFFKRVPLPKGDWIKEDSIRVPDGVSSCTIILPDSTYRMYYTGMEGILSAVSSDGLSWTKELGVRISPSAPGSEQERVCNCALIVFFDGYRMIYEGVKGVPGGEVHKLFSAKSIDGLTWVKEDGARLESVGTPDHGQVSVPDIIELPGGSYRMYYVGDFCYVDTLGNSIRSATSTDSGWTWTREGICIKQENTMDPDVILLPDSTYRMFYTSPPAGQLGNLRVYSALSSDGLNWTQEEGIRVAPGGEYDMESCMDPDVVELSDNSYRMYYSGKGLSGEINILSAISPESGVNESEKGITFSLGQNFPNPFSSATIIRYAIPKKTYVSLKIYDVAGRKVNTIVDKTLKPGYYTTKWDGKDNMGKKLSSGIYFIKFEVSDYKATKKLILMK